MSNVINKTTLEYKTSVNTPDFPTKDWIINPVLPTCEKKYWKIKSGKIAEMTAGEKATIDQVETDQANENEKEILIQVRMDKIVRDQAIAELTSEGKI